MESPKITNTNSSDTAVMKIKRKIKNHDRCAYCKAVRSANPQLKFFRFPQNAAMSKKWIKATKLTSLFNIPCEKLALRYRLCSKHFKDDDYATTKFHKLHPTAVPSLLQDGPVRMKLRKSKYLSLEENSPISCTLLPRRKAKDINRLENAKDNQEEEAEGWQRVLNKLEAKFSDEKQESENIEIPDGERLANGMIKKESMENETVKSVGLENVMNVGDSISSTMENEKLAMPGADAVVPISNSNSEPDVCSDSNIKDEKKKIKPLENGFNGHHDTKETTLNGKAVTSDVATHLRFDIFSSCKQLSAKATKHQNNQLVEETKEATSKFRSIASDIEICANQIRAFIKTRNIIFMSPLSSLKSNAQFKTLYSSVLNEDQKKTVSATPDQNATEVKEAKCSADVLEVVNVVKTKTNHLPPVGEFKRKQLQPGIKVYAMRTSQVGEFGEGVIISARDSGDGKLYKVRFDNTKTAPLKLFSAKQLAYTESPDVILPVGTRICARYCDGVRTAIYAGITAEPPKITNSERYLIFFDDGYAQYIYHHDIFAMCGQSNDVADDVHENLKEFIKAYLQKYPERPMVKLQQNQITKTEYECKWWDTKVLDIDASMVKMYFIESHRTEWIYRGSTRLKLLFNELQNAEEHRRAGGKNRRHNIVPRKPHQPYVEYTREEEVVTLDSDDENEVQTTAKYLHPRRKTGGSQYLNEAPVRNKARKSGSGAAAPKSRFAICNVPLKCRTPDIKSHLGYREIRRRYSFTRVNFQRHPTDTLICKEKENPANLKGQNPMLIPIHLGWERQVRKYKKKRSTSTRIKIIYRTPCGKHLRSLEEIQFYLYITSSHIPIDFFSVDYQVLVFRTFRPKEVRYDNKDITGGKENVPVACVNSWSNDPPPFVEYEAQRFPGKNVYLNLDPDFLCGCSCTDNCQDPEKCECQQITSYARYGSAGGEPVGYKFRRLKESIITGIYECNVKCKCSASCGNRVVQNGLQVRLQMFKTERKGWGIRCLDDLDAGQFICIYAGQLLTDQGADEDGNEFGDEYLAELDHIEVAEKNKEGYESDVLEMEEEYDEDKNDNKSDFSDDDPNDPDASFSSDENDSDFEPNLRSTAITSLSTRRSKKSKLDSDSSRQSMNDESEGDVSNGKRKNKWLPDLSKSLDMITITPRPLSPESAAFVDNVEFVRTPKLSDNAKTIAKKSLNSKQTTPLRPSRKENRFRTVRSYYGDESCYIMDAKSKGNIGRYLNHSCAPNVFVQNVFTDSHDLRFPAIAFFAMHYILAGTELTWDYNYEVGSVVDKVMYCYCDARNCRGRLL
ncbi:histone-lysine N-methyltransferase SETDB1-B isoform X1 [Parasteatoda tepidariorum]|uniref:histone-lysine N-methyltransferase SETDB1-B isoform X1 n=2 Tax=Parasteatoda tepidariorum TaxID=114398 RepID=UPI001C7238DB|nr:histone-lysine N-methyltransferase SETDB1 isoform X1 [Parasteatoda tepidariorum]